MRKSSVRDEPVATCLAELNSETAASAAVHGEILSDSHEANCQQQADCQQLELLVFVEPPQPRGEYLEATMEKQ
jgi:hypothetical protein